MLNIYGSRAAFRASRHVKSKAAKAGVVAELTGGDEVTAESARRWDEIAFSRAKAQVWFGAVPGANGAGFGPLNPALFVAWTLAMLHRTPEMTLRMAIFTALVTGSAHRSAQGLAA